VAKFKMRYDPGKPQKPSIFTVRDRFSINDGDSIQSIIDHIKDLGAELAESS